MYFYRNRVEQVHISRGVGWRKCLSRGVGWSKCIFLEKYDGPSVFLEE